jgi:hypothetical protein
MQEKGAIDGRRLWVDECRRNPNGALRGRGHTDGGAGLRTARAGPCRPRWTRVAAPRWPKRPRRASPSPDATSEEERDEKGETTNSPGRTSHVDGAPGDGGWDSEHVTASPPGGQAASGKSKAWLCSGSTAVEGNGVVGAPARGRLHGARQRHADVWTRAAGPRQAEQAGRGAAYMEDSSPERSMQGVHDHGAGRA